MIESGSMLQSRYRVTGQVAQGGMGAVYVATDERFNSTVAIKQTFFFDDPTLRKAFEREAYLLNHLRHPALPKVSDHFVEDNGQFLVMEFIEGDDLWKLLQNRGGAFPLADVMSWADELLDALDYLHTHEPPIIHRDIKPQNMKLTPRGRIVLLDFGLAKGTTAQTNTSVTGSILGYSPHYAPLEQIQGAGTDARSDLYSLAATLYHMLTGSPPVDALTRASAVINNQPDPLRPAHLAHSQVPEAISKVLRRALSQKAALRPATATEMRAALRQAMNANAPAVLKQRQSGFDEFTVLEMPGQSLHHRQFDSAPRSITLQRGSTPLRSETTVVDAVKSAARQPRAPYDGTALHTPPETDARKSPVKLLGLVLAFVACAVAVFALGMRSDKSPANSKVEINAPAGATGETQAGATTPTGDAAGESPKALSATERLSVPAHDSPAIPSGDKPESAVRSAPDNSGAAQAGLSDAVKNAGTNEAERTLSQTGTAAGRPSLVISAPAPSPLPVDDGARLEDERRRAEDFRRRQMEQRPPYPAEGHRPPPDRRPPPPPHHRPPPYR